MGYGLLRCHPGAQAQSSDARTREARVDEAWYLKDQMNHRAGVNNHVKHKYNYICIHIYICMYIFICFTCLYVYIYICLYPHIYHCNPNKFMDHRRLIQSGCLG